MYKEGIEIKRLISIAVILLLSSSIVFAQDFCKGDFDYDGDVDADDVTTFFADFGREPSYNPCTNSHQCYGDFDCDVDVDADDVTMFIEDFGREPSYKPCPASYAIYCPSGMIYCGDRCVDPMRDREYCGANEECLDGTICGDGKICVSGTCVINCPPNLTECDGTCVDTNTDEGYCGSCTNSCVSGEMCVASTCEIYCTDNCALVPKTGQTTCYNSSETVISCTGTGQDGEYRKGVAWPNPRFTDNLDGTITDNLTGLIWLKNANCIATNYPGFDNDSTAGDGRVAWQHALDFVAGINDGTYPNCGAGATDWRLPNYNELASLVHKGYYDPALPNTTGTGQWSEGDLFNNVQSYGCWSSTTYAGGSVYAWYVYMGGGYVYLGSKSYCYYVWPVRGGH